MRRAIVRGILVSTAVAALVVMTPAVRAQSPTAQRQVQQTVDPSVALLSEVRALRAELAEVSRISLRSQLLVARVQLQEQRIIYLDRRRAEIAGRVADAAEKTRQAATKTTHMAQALEDFRAGQSKVPAAEAEGVRREVAMQLEALRIELQAAQAQEQALRAEEAEIASGLATEQARWSDFNARLDELERALPTR